MILGRDCELPTTVPAYNLNNKFKILIMISKCFKYQIGALVVKLFAELMNSA